VVAFMLAFFSLAQQVQVSATGLDIGRLELQRQDLEDAATDIRSDLNRLGREPAIRKQAIDAGLGQLSDPIVLTPR
jgi:cell division protein FtsL